MVEDGESDERFYADLPDLVEFEQVLDAALYAEGPDSWMIALTDVRGSTEAIERGRYRDVNAMGVASIIGVLNAMRDVEIPYVFGGDGATLMIPCSRKAQAEAALRGTKRLARDAFGLELRCGLVPLAELRAQGHVAKVAPFRSSPHTRWAMFCGSGVSAAEAWVKDPVRRASFEVELDGDELVDFEGFECRWKPVPATRGKMVSLLILALERDEVLRAEVYSRVLRALESIIDVSQARPLKQENTSFAGLFADFSIEARIRGGARDGDGVRRALADARKKTLIARALGTLGRSAGGYDPKRYKTELIENTDFRKFDETLRMVVDLTERELQEVRDFLEGERVRGHLAYGTHSSGAALMTCLVRSYEGEHAHFVDGAEGGYALAARELKAQVSHRNSIVVPFFSKRPDEP